MDDTDDDDVDDNAEYSLFLLFGNGMEESSFLFLSLFYHHRSSIILQVMGKGGHRIDILVRLAEGGHHQVELRTNRRRKKIVKRN